MSTYEGGQNRRISDMLIEDRQQLSPAAMELVAAEQNCENVVEQDHSLRIKILDQCGMACSFCHNEGTPVTSDNVNRMPENFTAAGKSSRVSVFLTTNNANFVSGMVEPDEAFAANLSKLQSAVPFNEVHLTGGEPTLHPRLPEIVQQLKADGKRVKITSNGERFYALAPQLQAAGLDKVVFSIFGTTPEELAEVQGEKYQNLAFAGLKLAALRRSIVAANKYGIPACANIVMPGSEHAGRVTRLIEEFGESCKVRILNSLDEGSESYSAIYELLASLGAVPLRRNITAGASGMSVDYVLPDGKEVGFKQIRRSYLPVCNGCELKDNGCEEGYYGTRMYVDRNRMQTDPETAYKIGVCIQRMDLTKDTDAFVGSDMPGQIMQHRTSEYAMLTTEKRTEK